MTSHHPTDSLFSDAYAHHRGGRLDAAAPLYEQVLLLQPDHLDALHLRGLIAMQNGDYERARAMISAALALQPQQPNLLNSLGETLRRAGARDESESLLRRALALAPDNPDVMNNLGALLTDCGRAGEAVTLLEAVLVQRPQDAAGLFNLGLALSLDNQPEAALTAFDGALRLRPNWPDAVNSSALLLKNLGRIDAASKRLEACLEATGDPLVGGNLLLTLCYDVDLTPVDLLARHRQVAARIGLATGATSVSRHPQPPAPGTAPRIGFISGDFREHPIAFFVLPLLRGLKAIGVAAFAYGNHSLEDAMTAEISGLCAKFHHIESLSDDEAAQCIRNDAIDVLVDLSGHTGHNRLGIFMRRPAPIQVNWIGYLASTGLDCFDAHLSDALALPGGRIHPAYAEPIAYLPGCQWCYGPPPGPAPAPPRSEEPFVFGALHGAAKLNREVLGAWCQILEAIPSARLLLMAQGATSIRERLAAMGGSEIATRIDARPAASLAAYLQAHDDVDCILDAFPYTGGTTTFHALWMNTPVLTLTSDHPAGRGGASILERLELTDWVTTSVEGYVQRAISWTQRRQELTELRRGLRARLERSSLMDETGFARGFVATVAALSTSEAQANQSVVP
jgi:predicted O-linked N-acetylglucosamine transferase (SPINDLY family)